MTYRARLRVAQNAPTMLGGVLQRQLAIGRSDDPLEREADRAATQVMHGRSDLASAADTLPRLSRRSTPQPSQPAVAPTSVRRVLEHPGEPLPGATRTLFEPRFGHDFGRVRIHHDALAARSAREVDAHAYTVGRDVVFGHGQYAPDSRPGRELIAHELAHVVQQGGTGTVTRAQPSGASAHPPTLQRRSLWEGIAGLFSGDDFSDQALTDYLDRLDRTGAIEDYNESDNKARAVVRRWKRGDSRFLLTPARKMLLIREMFSGFTGNDDEQAILDLLRGSEDAEFDTIITTIGEAEFHDQFHHTEQDQLDALLASRRRSTTNAQAVERARTETLTPELALDLQRRFTSNAESTNRLNCIEIIRDIAPRLFADEPELAERVQQRLARLRGRTLAMTELGRVMSELGLASAYRRIGFNNGNGHQQPTEMQTSAWDEIIEMVGDVPGWHIFGLAVFDGYHSVTVLVDNRPDGPHLYWADQWRIDPGDDFHEEEGSVSGFRRYEQSGFDRFLNEFTESRWRKVFVEKGKRYDATLHIWKFRSSLTTVEERRLGTASEPAAILQGSRFDRFGPAFEHELSAAGSFTRAERTVRGHAAALWQEAVSRAQADSEHDTVDTDDRPLYWARLQMTRTLRHWSPRWHRGRARSRTIDNNQREKSRLLAIFERVSRGMDEAAFDTGADTKHILISGFDPFGLQHHIDRGNPSGAAVLALDNRTLSSANGVAAQVQGVIFPVRFVDFDQGMVERFFAPFIGGPHPPDMIMTISQGGREFEVEQFAGRRRSSGSFQDNLDMTSGGTPARPVVPPGLAPGPEFTETTLPVAAIRNALRRDAATPGETQVTEIHQGGTRPVDSPAGPTPGSTAVRGAGGGFLSNEIFYRTSLLRDRTGATIPLGHLHTPALQPASVDSDFAQHRDAIVARVEAILESTIDAL